MEHYYTKNPNAESHPEYISADLLGHALSFYTDAGVFSKKSVDFGTKVLVESFVPTSSSGSILDMGCGYGPVGISLGKHFPSVSMTMVDINERAIQLALKNARLNDVSNAKIHPSDLFRNVEGRFDDIVTNPPVRAGKQVVHQIFEDASRYLNNGGHLWVVIQKKQGAPSALEKLKTIYNKVETVTKEKGYYIFRARIIDGESLL